MVLLAYDGASAFDLNAAKQHAGVAVTGYLVGHPGGFDPVNKARVDQIRALGMGFLPNWERGAGYLVTCGKAGGVTAGQEALAAMRALGVPDNGTVACPFSWDVNVDPGQYPQCGQAADGIIAGLAGHYLFSTYGQGGLIDYMRASGRMKVKGWLSGSSSYPGFNASGPNVAMIQSHDAQGNWINTEVPGTDVNTVIDPHALGAWWPTGSPYAGGTAMALDNADKQWIHDTMVAVLRGEGVSGVAGLVATVLRSEGVSGAAGAVDPAKAAQAALADGSHGLAALAELVKAAPSGGQAGPVTGNVTGSITITPGA